MNHQHNIVVIGSSNTDNVIQVAHLPAPGETVLGGTFQQVAGGKGANQAVAAQRCGGKVAFIACVGHDALGEQAVKDYQSEGIDISAIAVNKEAKSGVALILVDDHGENSIAVASGANAFLVPRYIDRYVDYIDQAQVVLMQLETPIETIEHAIDISAQRGKTIILNPAPAQPLNDALLAKVTILTPNETEASALSGVEITDEPSIERAAKALLNRGVQQVIITLGELGCYYMSAQEKRRFSAPKVQPTDATAAGDTFNGALAAALVNGRNMIEAIDFAQAAAALSVTHSGAQPSIPRYETVRQFLSTMFV